MNYTKQTYIFGLIAAFAFASCADDLLIDSPEFAGSSEYISFAAGVSTAGALASRSADTPYEPYDPLVLDTDEGELPVYLHTYEHAIGSEYAEQQPQSRGEQVNNVPDFVRILKAFAVNGINSDGEVYFDMRKAHSLTEDNLYWSTDGLIRWPRKDRLQFHAIAPDNHLDKLDDVSYSDKAITFSYTAKKSNDGKTDAVAQTDLMMAVASMTLDQAADFDYHVPLKFNHALSAIKFAVRDVIKGKVKSITIKGVKGSGECTYTANYDSDGGNFEWDTESVIADAEFTQEFNYELNADFPFNTVNVDSEEAEEYDIVLTDKMPTKTFMLIPQVIPSDARIELVIEQELTEGNKRTITVGGKIGNNVKEWLPGYEYIYTISTSKDNWIYVFDAEGNVDTFGGSKNHKENIYVYSPADEEFDVLDNNAYFNVKSYRYRANNMEYVEPLPWKASHDGSLSYWVNGSSETAYPSGNEQMKYVQAAEWITDQSETPLNGEGIGNINFPWEKHDLVFLPHYLSTTWKGDETMQAYKPYEGYTKENPYDLSTFGGKIERNTANCYVIDRGGWYMFPLAYGNAIKNGADNPSSYRCQNTSTDASLRLLPVLSDYNDNPITTPYINVTSNGASAELLWQDAYDLVDYVELVTINGERMIRFYAEPNNLQQGNAVIALKTVNGNVRWSWHIWATEHWLDPNPSVRLSHFFKPDNSTFTTYQENPVTNIRERGDVAVTYNQYGRTFMMSPYNVGYCDPKSVLYLKRKSEMKFVQYMPDKKSETGLSDKLEIIQDGTTIEYKYANNTYYQWGRKDPMRGFFDHEHSTKRVFGSTPPVLTYLEDISAVSIGRSIKHPEEVYVSRSGTSGSKYEDWLTTNFKSNLWNNASVSSLITRDSPDNDADLWSHTKTVYDPSPAGYMVPNAGVWHVIQKNHSTQYTFSDGTVTTYNQYKRINGVRERSAQRDKWAGGNWSLNFWTQKVNGKLGKDSYNYLVWAQGNAENLTEALFFSSTGNRWWTDGWKPNDIGAGGNFGRNVSYAWSNRSYISYNPDNTIASETNAYGMAIGLDTDREEGVNAGELRYYVGGQFIGRRTMGRPVRAIREP